MDKKQIEREIEDIDKQLDKLIRLQIKHGCKSIARRYGYDSNAMERLKKRRAELFRRLMI